MKKRIVGLLLIGFMTLATACGGSSSSTESAVGASNSFASKNSMGFEESAVADYETSDTTSESAATYDYAEDASAPESGEPSEVDLSEYDTSRKLIYNSYISLESKKFDEDVRTIKELVASNGGYFESTSTYGNVEYGNRSASFLARIPADKYDAFMGSVGDVGSLTSKNESVDDITSSYVDVQARIKSLNTKLERLQELEANAENVTELLEIEDRINEVQYQIESYTAQMKTYDDQVDYSTVNIDISEVATYSEVKADSAWNRFSEAFRNSFVGFVSFLQGFVIGLIYLLPYLLIIGIIVLIVFCIVRRNKKKKNKKNKEISEEKEKADGETNK